MSLLLAACSGRMVGGDAGHDSGPPVGMDAGPPMGMDAGPPVGTDAGPGTDAGMPDAGPPPCMCPTFPTTCSAPAPATPAFTPDATDAAGQLFDVIACAQTSLHLAVYEGEWACLANAINDALMRTPALEIEVVVDDDRCAPGSCFVDALMPTSRVTVVRDTRSGLMHHKFAVADGTRLWVSSANFSERSFCYDHNNTIVIEESAIVDRYDEVFDRMFTMGNFSPVAPEGPTTAGLYTVYFSPESPISQPPDWMDDMIAEIGGATTSADIMMFAWTRTEVSDALVTAAGEGVTVRALVSPVYANDAPAMALIAAGIEVRVAPVHSKVLVLDDQLVITGSANWSMNAWSNNENSLWIDDATVAAAYGAEFDALWATSSPPTSM